MCSLSVCIITSNEEKNLTRCLNSIKPIADEIIIVDTTSNDYVTNLGIKFNAKVIDFNFENDFSKVNNIGIENCSMDWILLLKSDECIDLSQTSNLKDKLSLSPLIAYNLKLVNIIDNSRNIGEYILRLFKNNSGFNYINEINEELSNSILSENYNDFVSNLDVNIYSYSYDISKRNLYKRCYRNISIYSNVKLENKNYEYYFLLANEYYLLENYNKAINNYTKALYSCTNIYISSYITYVILKTYYVSKKYSTGLSLGEYLLNKYDKVIDVYLILSMCAEKCGDMETYKNYYKLYLTSEKRSHKYYLDLYFIHNPNIIPEMFGFKLNNIIKQ